MSGRASTSLVMILCNFYAHDFVILLIYRTKDIPDLDKKIEETNAAIEVLRQEKEGKDAALKVLL